jgi:C-terminal processing protease CtpA/Prc
MLAVINSFNSVTLICAKRDTYPDGRDFIGVGIKPDIEVSKVVEDYLNGVDTELNEAFKVLIQN